MQHLCNIQRPHRGLLQSIPCGRLGLRSLDLRTTSCAFTNPPASTEAPPSGLRLVMGLLCNLRHGWLHGLAKTASGVGAQSGDGIPMVMGLFCNLQHGWLHGLAKTASVFNQSGDGIPKPEGLCRRIDLLNLLDLRAISSTFANPPPSTKAPPSGLCLVMGLFRNLRHGWLHGLAKTASGVGAQSGDGIPKPQGLCRRIDLRNLLDLRAISSTFANPPPSTKAPPSGLCLVMDLFCNLRHGWLHGLAKTVSGVRAQSGDGIPKPQGLCRRIDLRNLLDLRAISSTFANPPPSTKAPPSGLCLVMGLFRNLRHGWLHGLAKTVSGVGAQSGDGIPKPQGLCRRIDLRNLLDLRAISSTFANPPPSTEAPPSGLCLVMGLFCNLRHGWLHGLAKTVSGVGAQSGDGIPKPQGLCRRIDLRNLLDLRAISSTFANPPPSTKAPPSGLCLVMGLFCNLRHGPQGLCRRIDLRNLLDLLAIASTFANPPMWQRVKVWELAKSVAVPLWPSQCSAQPRPAPELCLLSRTSATGCFRPKPEVTLHLKPSIVRDID